MNLLGTNYLCNYNLSN